MFRGNIKLPSMKTEPPSPSKGFMASARYFFAGAKFLSQGGHEVAIACAHLAAQALECSLKAYLVCKGMTVKTLKNEPYKHDLVKLWEEAETNGLKVPKQPPDWCLILNQTHNAPYHLRYPTKVNTFAVPAFSQMAADLSKLIDEVGVVVR